VTVSLRDGGFLLVPVLVLLAAPGCGCARRGVSSDGPGRPLGESRSVPSVTPTPAATGPASSPRTGEVRPTPLTACKADGDCVATAGDCCGCNAGGSQAVVNRATLDEFEAARTKRCGEAVCVALMSSHPSCSQQPRCVGGSCRLVGAGDGGVKPAAPQ
jgi:hypothetical protein